MTEVTIVGNLTGDPELRHTSNGLAVVSLTIASTPKTFDKATNEWKDGETLFLRASAWREFAENIAASLTKGMRVVATGKLRQRNYQTKEGENRSSIELELDEIGPSLRFARATVVRGERVDRGGFVPDAGAGWAQEQVVGSGVVGGEQPPF